MPTTRELGPFERAEQAAIEAGLQLRFDSGLRNLVADDDIFEIVQDHTPTDPRVLAWMLEADPSLGQENPSEVWNHHHGYEEDDPAEAAELVLSGSTPELQRVAANVSSRLEAAIHNAYVGDLTAVDELTVVLKVSKEDGLRFHSITTHRTSKRVESSTLGSVGSSTGPLRNSP